MESLDRTNGEIGGGRLSVAPDLDLLDPCAEPLPRGEQCAGTICNQALGEVNKQISSFINFYLMNRFAWPVHFVVVRMARRGHPKRINAVPWNLG
jgi:hypothetical protein